MQRIGLAWVFAVALVYFAGCGGGSSGSGGGGGFGSGSSGKLYVSNLSRNSVLRWDQANMNLAGNTPPNGEITGSSTKLQAPRGIYLDSSADFLYIANFGSNSILIFDKASKASGDIAPKLEVAGDLTQLDGPTQVAVDGVRGLTYVANSKGNNILVFHDVLSGGGNIAPVRSITSTFPFNSPVAVYLDAANDRLYVADSNNSAIQVFDNASTLIGDSKPVRRLAGASTTLNQPIDVFIDLNNLVVIDKAKNAVLTFAGAATVDGDVAPSKSITSPAIVGPVQAQATTSGLYVGCAGNSIIAIFKDYSLLNGNSDPSRTLDGDNTHLSGINGAQGIAGLAFDPTR